MGSASPVTESDDGREPYCLIVTPSDFLGVGAGGRRFGVHLETEGTIRFQPDA
jgi:hypothetical protein